MCISMKAARVLMISAALVLTIGSASAGETKVITSSTTMYSGAPIERYLSPIDLLIDEAAEACPNGVQKITEFKAEVKGEFVVTGLETQAVTYPTIEQTAVVVCK